MVSTYIPKTVEEALEIRSCTGAHPLAGGTDLMVAYRRGEGTKPVFPWPVMLIGGLRELKGIEADGKGNITIGALEVSSAIADNPLVPWHLRQAAGGMGAISLRNQATIGGNIANASPKGDMPAALILLDAMVVLTSLRGKRTMKVDDFIIDAKKTALADDELITSVIIPPPMTPFTYLFYRKVGTRRANAISKINLSAAITLKDDGTIEDFRASSGAAGPKVERSRRVEQSLIGRNISDVGAFLPGFLKEYDAIISPHAMPAFRRRVTANLLRFFLTKCATRPEGRVISWEGTW